MDDLAGGAAAPADTNAVATDPVVTPPNPISTDPKPAEPDKDAGKDAGKVEEKKGPTTREALKAAAAKVAEKSKAEEAAAEEAKKPAPVQSKTPPAPKGAEEKEAVENRLNPDRVDVPKAQIDKLPPARFSTDAKAAWEAAPEPIRAEVHRAIRELEQGHEKYRADAEAFNEVREYHDLAKSVGTTMKAAMANYVGIERLIAGDPIAGFARVAQNMNLDIRQIAAAILGQDPRQVSSQQDQTIRELRNELQQLKQEVTGASTFVKEQRDNTLMDSLTSFAKDHPRLEELADDVAFFIETQKAKNLDEAYDLACRLNPAPVASQAAVQTATDDLAAQTRKGGKSISGAPTPGSDPVTKRPSTSIKDSLRRAVAQTG